jgi:small subunit ribosomal protein S2
VQSGVAQRETRRAQRGAADIKAAADAAAGTTAAEVDLSKIELPADVAAVVEGEVETEAGLPKKRITRARKAVVKAE